MISIDITRTYYPHWGGHSGIHQFVKHLDQGEFTHRIKAVPMGDDFNAPERIRKYIKKKIADNNVSAYKLNDFRSELSILCQSLFNAPDIVHLLDAEHSLMFLPKWLNSLNNLKRTPKIIAMFHQPVAILDGLINKDIVKNVDCVLVVAPEQVDYFRQFMPEDKIKIILHGIDTEYFKPGAREKKADKLICIAAGVWLRDYNAVIETARLLKGKANFEFHIIASEITIPKELDNIIVHRNIPDAEMLDLYQKAHVLFMPLETATANNVLLEGSACGLPVVSSGIRAVETYFPGKEAALVHDNKASAFAEILIELDTDRGKLEEMSNHARARAEQLSWEKIALEYAALYRSLCC